MNVQRIKVDLIDPQLWNSRLKKWGNALIRDQAEFEELKESMNAERGLIEPIVVHVNGDRFTLGIGSRRLQAARELEWKEIDADVRTEPPSVEDNITENLRRQALTSYEEARACLALREEKKSLPQIATILGRSDSKIRNTMATVTNLAPPILQDWEQDHPASNVEFFRELATPKRYPTQDDQVKAWEARKAAYAKVEESGEGSTKTRERQTRPPKNDVPMAICPVCTHEAPRSVVSQYDVKLKPAALKAAKKVAKNMKAKTGKKGKKS